MMDDLTKEDARDIWEIAHLLHQAKEAGCTEIDVEYPGFRGPSGAPLIKVRAKWK